MTGWRLTVWMFTSVCPAAVPWREMGHRHTCLKVGCRNTTSRWVLHRGLAMQTILTLQGQNRVAMIMETTQQNSIKPTYCIKFISLFTSITSVLPHNPVTGCLPKSFTLQEREQTTACSKILNQQQFLTSESYSTQELGENRTENINSL